MMIGPIRNILVRYMCIIAIAKRKKNQIEFSHASKKMSAREKARQKKEKKKKWKIIWT